MNKVNSFEAWVKNLVPALRFGFITAGRPGTKNHIRIVPLALLLILFSGATVYAETKSWGGTTGTGLDWTLPANWSGGVAPVAGDDIVFDTPGEIVFSILPASVSYNSVTILQGTVTLAAASATTFTLGGAAGTDLSVAAGSSLTIGLNANITMAAGASADISGALTINAAQTFIAGGALSAVNISGTLTNNGTYNASTTTAVTTVTGRFINSWTVSNSTASRVIFSDGSIYDHARNSGTVPTATWAVTSDCIITGATTSRPTIPDATQPFGNFTWNCTAMSSFMDLAGQLKNVAGNFTVKSTNNRNLILGYSTSSNLTVGGNFVVEGGNLGIGPQASANTGYVSVGGDFIFTGGTLYLAPALGAATMDVAGNFSSSGSFNYTFTGNDAAAVVNVNGDCSITGGEFDMSETASQGVLNVAGNFSHTGGTITENGTGGSGMIAFNGSTMQTYTSGGTVSQTINFTVNDGSYLQMAAPETVITGAGTFTLSEGATLGVTSPEGIVAETAMATGNILTTTGRVFAAGANYIYNGSSAQVTGSGLTQNTPATVTFNNNAGVTMSGATTVSGLFTLAYGALDMSNNNLTAGSLTGAAGITNVTGTPSAVTLAIGSDNTTPSAYSGDISDGTATTLSLEKSGTGTLILSGANSYSGSTTITDGMLQMGSETAMSNNSRVVLNGGTLSTGSAAGYNCAADLLSLDGSSTISLGTGNHSLRFNASNGEAWNTEAILTINGWEGTPGTSGSAGKIFAGTDASGLTTDQLAQIAFTGHTQGAEILPTGEVVPQSLGLIEIASANPAVTAAEILQNSTDNVIYLFSNNITVNSVVMSGLQITTAGSYVQEDVTSLKAWYSADNTFNSSSDILLSTKSLLTGPGTHIFPDWTNQTITNGSTGYIFITADLACGALAGNDIYVMAVTTADVSFISGIKSGTAYDGGLMTITDAAPVDVTVPSASVEDSQSSLSWTNPSCFDEIMIVAKEGSAVTIQPAGNGDDYTADTYFGGGTEFDGGYVVFKGSVSPVTIQGLSNETSYYFTFFTRKGEAWSSGITTSVIPMSEYSIAFRSAGSGLWSSAATWELSINGGSSWVPASKAPDSDNGQITIRNGHNVEIDQEISVDQVTVDQGGVVTLTSVNMTINNGAEDTDFYVAGTLSNNGTIIISGSLSFGNGATYVHARDNGSIPLATWDINSKCIITGVISSAPTITDGQAFGNFEWNCTGQTGLTDLKSQLITINGNLTIRSTGSSTLYLGRYTAANLTVGGNVSVFGGTLALSGNSLTGTINVAGNFTHSGGRITETSSGKGSIVFNGAAMQIYTSGGQVLNTINYTVNAGSYLQMASESTTISGGGTFTLSDGATLGITSGNGIMAAGTASGNIRTTTRVYGTGANYIYNGTVNQASGSGLPATVNSLTVANAGSAGNNTVTMSKNTVVTSDLSVASGVLALGAFTADRSATGGTLAIADGATLKIGGTNTLPANYGSYSLGTSATVEYNGAAQTITPLTYSNLTASGTGPKTITAGTAVTVNGALSTGNLITIESTITSSGSLIANATSTGTVTYNRQLLTGTYGDRHYLSSPVASNTDANAAKVETVWSYNEADNTWPIESGLVSLTSGKGYNLKQISDSDGLISFTGSVVTSPVSLTLTSPYLEYFDGSSYDGRAFAAGRDDGVSWGGGGWNLMGNPYTSAINAVAFINENISLIDPNYRALYVYRGEQNDYADFGILNPGDIQAGQGFWTMAMYNDVSVRFVPGTTGMQTHSTGTEMLKSATAVAGWPGLDLKVMSGTFVNATHVIYDNQMKAGLDPGYDVGKLSTSPAVEIYTALIQDNGVNFKYQALPIEGCAENIIAVGIDTRTGGEIVFSADIVPVEDYIFYLEDRTAGIFTNLSTNTYTVTMPANSYGTGRFYLHASNTGTPTGTDPGSNDGLTVRIWAYDNNILVKGEVSNDAVCEVYDMQGRKVSVSRLTDPEMNIIPMGRVSKGVYIVVVKDGGKTYRQKVILL